ncbi:MAG: hypothetical protein ACE5NP_08545, partial [Anaerolineae bacterium]
GAQPEGLRSEESALSAVERVSCPLQREIPFGLAVGEIVEPQDKRLFPGQAVTTPIGLRRGPHVDHVTLRRQRQCVKIGSGKTTERYWNNLK